MDGPRKRYLIGDYRLEPDKQSLTRAGLPVHLPKRPFQVLLYLIEHRDRYVGRAELLDTFWDGKDVYDDALRKSVGAIRKALEDQPDEARYIETRWGVGYRYVGAVEEQVVSDEPAVTEVERTRGVRIVVEEEEIQGEAAERAVPSASPAAAHALAAPAPKRFRKAAALTLAFLAVALGAFLLSSYRSHPDSARAPAAPAASVAVLPLKN